MRKTIFANSEVYHVFNRGVEKRPTFTDKRELDRAILTLDYYRFITPLLRLSKVLLLNKEERFGFLSGLRKKDKKHVKVLSFCLMPNHFHFLLRQELDKGIQRFVSNFTNSYTRYFNTKHKRVGPLFQGIFKAVHIEDDEQLLHVHRYIQINPTVSFVVEEEELENYQWCSLPEYLGKTKEEICEKGLVMANFSSLTKYKKFIFDQIDYARKLEQIKHLTLE